MKLYMHPVSMTSRPVRLFIAEKRHQRGRAGRRPVHRRALQGALCVAQSEPPGADAGGRRSSAHRELGDPEVPRRQDRLARLSEGPEAARQGQRDDGLAEHELLSRVRLQPDLPAALSAHEAAERRGADRRRWSGARSAPSGWLQDPRTTTGSGRTTSTCAATRSRSPTISAPHS